MTPTNDDVLSIIQNVAPITEVCFRIMSACPVCSTHSTPCDKHAELSRAIDAVNTAAVQAAIAVNHLVPREPEPERPSTPCANCRKPTTNRNFVCDECESNRDEIMEQQWEEQG